MTGEDKPAPFLPRVPAALFTATMGLTGLGLTWRAAAEVLGWPVVMAEMQLSLAAAVFIVSLALYGAKLVLYPQAVISEFKDPVTIAFFPAISISLLLLAAAALPYSRDLGTALWTVGASLQLPFALAAVNRWITHNYEIQLASPTWFIPGVGNVIVGFAGVKLGHVETTWFFFAFGILFWLLLSAIVLNRIIFHDQLPDRYLPTLFILLAPPAAGYISYAELSGGSFDYFARFLFHTGIFFSLLLFTMARQFLRLPFSIGWWAYGFPAAAMGGASLRYHAVVDSGPSLGIALFLTIVVSVLIYAVLVRSVVALFRGEFFTPG